MVRKAVIGLLGQLVFGKRVWLGVGLSLLIALLALGWLYRAQLIHATALQADIAGYESRLEQQALIIEQERTERRRVETVLLEREANQRAAHAEVRQLRGDIHQLRKAYADVEKWARQRVPAVVLGRVRNTVHSHQCAGDSETSPGCADGTVRDSSIPR